MEFISQKNLHDYCRACLQELKQRQQYNIYCLDVDIRQWLQDATLESPLAKDIYSRNICILCRDKLQEFLEFRKMCSRSQKTITDIIEKEKHGKKIQESNENDEKDVLDKNQDWLEFDFIAPTKTESPIIDKKEFDVEEIEVLGEPLINDTFQSQLKEERSEQIESFKKEEAAESSGNDHDSGSDYELKENYENSDSDCSSERNKAVAKTRATRDNDQKQDKVKTTPSKKNADPKKKPKFQCDQCDRRCLNQQTLDNHLRTHQGLKPFQCPQCDRSFNKSNHLQEHINALHAEEKINIVCDYEGCGKQYQSHRTYKEHYRVKHMQPKDPQPQPKHICEDCGKGYVKMGSLKLHQFTHKSRDQYPYQCTICGKAFCKRYAFDAHQLRHAGIKNFECPHCGMKKTTKDELQIHINYHTKEKQWHCTRCPMVFNSSGNLRTHDQVVHQGLRRYACRYCEEAFGKPDSLKRHEMRHTGEKPHACAECGKRFIQKVALRTHMKTHNKYSAKHHQTVTNIVTETIIQ